MKSIKPSKLKIGDTIGLIAPSNPLNTIKESNIKIGLDRLKNLGFNIKLGRHIYVDSNRLIGTINQRVEDIMEMFSDKSVNAIMTAIGGYNSNEVIEFLDYELIRDNPKIFIGYSDITALNISIYKMAGLINFSGPSFALFCQKDFPHYTLEYFNKALMSSESFFVRASNKYAEDKWFLNNESSREWKVSDGFKMLNGRDFSGDCVGGNLQTLMALNGTRFFPSFKSKVLFLEESENKPGLEIRRYLTQLKQMGVFKEINGLLVGRFCSSSDLNAQDDIFVNMIKEILEGYEIPIVYNVDFGHTDPIITIPLGVKCYFDFSTQTIKFDAPTID